MPSRMRALTGLALAALAAVSMWFYADRILVPYQIKEAIVHDRPRGNLSDLYPRWLGARELLLHRRNPYGDDITAEIQKGYYGRVLDAALPNDPKDRQGFAYPVYVVFLLAPLVWLPFSFVQTFFYWVLALLTAMSVLLWFRVLEWKLGSTSAAAALILTMGSFPVVQGIKLQQLSLLVAALLAGAASYVAGRHLSLGGALLALATIKPQLAWILAGWLVLWAASDWRARRNFIYGFGVVMALLLCGGEVILPGWLAMFVHGVGQYHQYTQNQSLVEVGTNLVAGWFASPVLVHRVAQALSAVSVILCVPVFWRLRNEDAHSVGFGYATALALALTVLVVPMYAPYNQMLLLPAIFLLARTRAAFSSPTKRLLYVAAVVLLAWPWTASLFLTLFYLLVSPAKVLNWWTLPLFSTFALPLVVFVLTLMLWKPTLMQPQEGRS